MILEIDGDRSRRHIHADGHGQSTGVLGETCTVGRFGLGRRNLDENALGRVGDAHALHLEQLSQGRAKLEQTLQIPLARVDEPQLDGDDQRPAAHTHQAALQLLALDELGKLFFDPGEVAFHGIHGQFLTRTG